MIPYHVQPCCYRGGIGTLFFCARGKEFKLVVEESDGTAHDGGLCRTYLTPTNLGECCSTSWRESPPRSTSGPRIVRRRRCMLHLYVRHRRDKQAYGNEWIGDFRLASITTYEVVANYCKAAMESGGQIRIHRRKFENIPATVCCECSIKVVTPIPGTNGFKVEFSDWTSLSVAYDKRLQQGYYFADPSYYEPAAEEEDEPCPLKP
jgi:hypothetical protein